MGVERELELTFGFMAQRMGVVGLECVGFFTGQLIEPEDDIHFAVPFCKSSSTWVAQAMKQHPG
jgi:hypothetical protein